MTHLSKKLEKLNIDIKRLTDRLKWLVEYKKLENKPRNGINCLMPGGNKKVTHT